MIKTVFHYGGYSVDDECHFCNEQVMLSATISDGDLFDKLVGVDMDKSSTCGIHIT